MTYTDLFLTCLGLCVGIFSGLLGVGGGILMVPALVFVLPGLGINAYGIHAATGISILQSFVGGSASFWTHFRRRTASFSSLKTLAVGSMLGGLSGGLASAYLPALVVYALFAMVLLNVLILSFRHLDIIDTPHGTQPTPRLGVLKGIIFAGFISFIAANTGIGGAVLLTPALIYIKHFPTRTAIGIGAGFVVVTSLSAVAGKLLSNQIPFPDALWVCCGAFVGGTLGARLSHKLSPVLLHRLLLVFVTLTLIRVLWEILQLAG